MKLRFGWQNLLTASAAILLMLTACTKQISDAERMERGRALVRQMSDKLASSNTLSFSTVEYRDIVAKDGRKTTVQRGREAVLRRPNRFYTNRSGDQPMEAWYDGKHVTLAMHSDKVYGQIRMPETFDETLDALSKRFGIILPIGDFLNSRPESVLVTEDMKGGYAGTEKINGVDCHHLSFVMPAVDWEMWIPTEGEPLPKRIKVIDKNHKGKPVTDVSFSKWNLAAVAPDDLFKPKVPQEYEGIAVLQRAAVMKKSAAVEQPDARSRSAQTTSQK